VGKVEIQVFSNITGKIGVGDGYGIKLLHVAENDINARGIDRSGRDNEVGEVMEVRDPEAGECFKGVDASEGSERGGKFGREANGGDGAVEEGEGLEGSEGESDVVWGAVGEGKGEEVAEGLGGVAEGGVVLALAGVLGGWDVEGLKGSQLLWVKRGGRRRRWRRRRWSWSWRGSGRGCGGEGVVLLLLLVVAVERRRRTVMLLLLPFCWFSVNSAEGEADS